MLAEEISSSLHRTYASAQPLNRQAFKEFALRVCHVEAKYANEIFSCATNSYGRTTSQADVEMNPTEFSIAFVRLANLWTIAREGMEDATNLTVQTAHLVANLRC